MKTFKNLLIYSVSLIALFSLTAISCDDALELPNITAPMTIVETVEVKTEGAIETSITKTIDPNDSEIKEYKDRLEKFEADKIIINVIDNGSAGIASGGLYMMLGGTKYAMTPDGIFNNIMELNGYTMEFSTYEGFKESIENHIANTKPLESIFDLKTDGAVDYTVTVTIEGVVTAKAK